MIFKTIVFLSHIEVLLILSFATSSFAVPSSNMTDEEALVAFSSAITYEPTNTIMASNWTRGANFCDWVGVTCSKRRQRVAALNFYNMGLEGTISPYVGNLSFLVSLVLSNNSFHGHIPSELGHLRRLKILLLEVNRLEGSIPSSLHNCFKLEVVSVAVNMLSGSIPGELGTLKNLHELYLGENNLTGTIPVSIGNMSALEEFIVPDNIFTGSFPSFMFNISSIEAFSLNDNSFTAYLPIDICLHWPRLEVLYLAGNQFIGRIPSTLPRHCTGLRWLDLSRNELNGSVPTEFGTLQKLEVLSLEKNYLTGTIPTCLGNISSLAKFSIASNNIRGGIPDEFTELTKLEVLNLQHNHLSGTIPRSLFNISSLTVISIVNNSISGDLPPNTGLWLPNLERMYLFNNQIGGSIPAYLSNSSKLFLLDISFNLFTGQIPSSLGNLPRLRFLYMEYNKLTRDPGFEELRFLTALTSCRFIERLSIENNRLGGVLPYSIGNFSDSLQTIDASENQIKGPIPESIGALRNLNYLVLGDNNLNGTIPPTIGNLRNLQRLHIYNTQIGGSIPEEMCNLRNLGELTLEDNRLTGPIPPCIGSLKDLQRLNLSNNSLTSSIPESFWTLENLIFMDLSSNSLSGNLSSEMKMSRVVEEMHISRNQITAVLVFVCLLCMLRAFKHKNKTSTLSSSESIQIPEHKLITYHELRHATNDFSEANLLGIGSYGSVYMGTIFDGTVVAIKVLNPKADGAFKSFDAECKVLRTTRHRNLVKIITSCSNPEFRALIMEYMSNGSLEKWLYSENRNLNLFQRINIMIDVATALDYLHYGQSEPVVHCDLKPSNILLDEDMVAHVGDFGIARILPKAEDAMHTKTLGTIGYVAPEYGLEGRVSIKGDMYSYGIMMLEIVTGKKPTDEMFIGEVSLRHWVSTSFPNTLLDVVDHVLKPNGNNVTDVDMIQGFLFSLLEMGLECSRETPEERIDVKDIVAKLTQIKLKILHIQRYRPVFLAS
ncbi:receptor kinase-like protein Xa21 isoform X3 [Tripterygium wilfordii]|uniref:receptor kinase-like protein Xa21 isoform X3 n=1 Tax=Tripterygium wilfordii TaxID=458696 RepID=UPI0018F804DA|nr:receptor kinase-like protein Xa21 isoform X3 [Tripterygium wilfordii]